MAYNLSAWRVTQQVPVSMSEKWWVHVKNFEAHELAAVSTAQAAHRTPSPSHGLITAPSPAAVAAAALLTRVIRCRFCTAFIAVLAF